MIVKLKLSSKLILFITGSKVIIVILFILTLPILVKTIASQYIDHYLQEQRTRVINIVNKNGIDYYLQGEQNYGSYTMLKEEYIALEPILDSLELDTIRNSLRIVEQDTLAYRVLSHTFKVDKGHYLLEIGKTTSSIDQYNQLLQRVAFYILLGLIAITLLVDLIFTRLLIRPLNQIIKNKLINRKFPFKGPAVHIKTTTIDFKYLDDSIVLLMEQITEAFEKEREFTANASHELLTPISILQNKMENLIMDEEIGSDVALRIVEMMKTLDRLKKISNSLLLISRIENEQFTKTDQIKPRRLFNEILEEIEHRMNEKELKITLDVSFDMIFKNVNKDLLFQMFYNLINNAIRYNKVQGSIAIFETYTRNGEYAIHIHDTGMGISETDLPHIFNRFKKGGHQENNSYGLGLSIVKSIADYHELRITVDSSVNKGTTFAIAFPQSTIAGLESE